MRLKRSCLLTLTPAKLIDDLGTSTTDANDLVRGMLQASITRGLNAEMDARLGYESSDRSGKAAAGTDNHRNGSYPKTVDSNYGPVTVDVPRDRAGTFLPTMVPKGSRRLTDVDDMIVSLYAGGMTIRDIQHHMATAMRVDRRFLRLLTPSWMRSWSGKTAS